MGTVLLVASATAACGTKRVDICNTDSDCTNIAYPFCDVNGEYSASEGETNVCTIVPPDCPIERCGCSPGATTCDQDQLVVCNTDGMSTTTTGCTLGWADAKDHCLTFEPSNGLGTPLAGASTQPDVTIPDGSYIDTDSGTVSGPNGTIAVESLLVSQPSGDIRVFVANTFTISSVKITAMS